MTIDLNHKKKVSMIVYWFELGTIFCSACVSLSQQIFFDDVIINREIPVHTNVHVSWYMLDRLSEL